MALTKVTERIISDNLSISGIATAGNFKTGTTNVHNVGVELAGINVLGGDTPIGTGATVWKDGGALFSGIVTATTFKGAVQGDVTGNVSGNVTGNISGGTVAGSTGTFSSNVTISGNLGVAGTITYEDVARVDATGISTFREGFHLGPLAGIGLTAYKDGSIRTSGIVTATSFSGSGANLTALNANNISAGIVTAARLGGGTASNTKYLRGDGIWDTVSGTTINNNADNKVITGSGTANTLEGESTLTWNGSRLGVGVASPHSDTTLHVYQSATDSSAELRVENNRDRNAYTLYKTTTGDWACGTGIGGAWDEFHIYDAGQSAIKLTVKPTGDIVPGGNLIFAAGKGIDFSETANAAAQSSPGTTPTTSGEVLKSYEYGTWTPWLRGYNHSAAAWGIWPTDSGSAAGSGKYVKIGRLVNIWGKITGVDFGGGTDYPSIWGVPYSGDYGANSAMLQAWGNAFTNSDGWVGGGMWGSGGEFLTGRKPNTEATNLTIATSGTKNLYFGGSYYTTSED